MKIKTRLRARKDHFVVTIYKKDRKKLDLGIGDLIIFRINNVELVKKIAKDYHISLPIKLLNDLNGGDKIELDIVSCIGPDEAQTRATKTYEKDHLDLSYFIPKTTSTGKPIFVIPRKGNKITVWYPIPGGVKHITLNRFTHRYAELFEVEGFLFGDGSIKGIRSLRFTNSEPSTLLACLEFFERIGLPRDMWKCQIIYSGPHPPSNVTKEKCMMFWSAELGLPLNNIKSVLWSKNKGSKAAHGSARIFIDNAALYEIFVLGVLNKILEKVDNSTTKFDHHVVKCFLRGIFAAEAAPRLKNSSLRRVELSFNPHSNEAHLFHRMLSQFGIPATIAKSHNCMRIDGWTNFSRLFSLDIFKLHKKRNKEFVNGFLNHKLTQSRVKYFSLLHNKGLRVVDTSKKLGISSSASADFLNKMVKENLVCKNGNLFQLSSEGEHFMEMVQDSVY